MTRWKLTRQFYGNEEFTFLEGAEVTVGRAMHNTIALSSVVVSRNHCVINFKRNKVIITDLQSANGVYVGTKKIPMNTPTPIEDSDVIGFGWALGAPVAKLNDKDKYMFKLAKEIPTPTVPTRIRFQSESEVDTIEAELAALNKSGSGQENKSDAPEVEPKTQLKRKLKKSPKADVKTEVTEIRRNSHIVTIDEDVINILSESDIEEQVDLPEIPNKIPKLEPLCVDPDKQNIKEELKTENENLEYEAFSVKQEYFGYNDEPIQIDSDDDSECEHWMIRLSQSSPGKPFTKVVRETNTDIHEESSYSQLDDGIDEEEFVDDLITIPPQPPEEQDENTIKRISDKIPPSVDKLEDDDEEEFLNDLISIETSANTSDTPVKTSETLEEKITDEVDGTRHDYCIKNTETTSLADMTNEKFKRAQMIEPLVQIPRRKSISHAVIESKHKSSSSIFAKDKKHSSSKKHKISHSQKEERKKKLKEIATKEKGENEKSRRTSTGSLKHEKPVVNAKVTTSNRGAFLSDVVQPMKLKESPQKTKSNDTRGQRSPNEILEIKHPKPIDDIENKKKHSEKAKTEEQKSGKRKDKLDKNKGKSNNKSEKPSSVPESRIPLKSLKPLSETEETFSGKPFSKVGPYVPQKPKKKVRFSDAGPQVHVFEIEEGNKLKKTSLAKDVRENIQNTPIYSLEKITLVKILRWNPQWLDEQMNLNEPPPILGHNSPPLTIFHSFNNHSQYVQLIGDLLLMEIWECLTQSYMRIRGQNIGHEMRIESLPPIPSQERQFELFNLSVNISVPNAELKTVPRMGEVMVVVFGPANARNRRFFFVHNVRCLPSPPKNIYSFFSISLHACYTDKMKSLRPGEVMVGCSLAYINNELMLFEAMENLRGSPLSEAILRPEPRHFIKQESSPVCSVNEWTKTLNPSQQMAVNSSVAAAMGDRPCIQMVQGPPGTGKSSVICAIVLSYFYGLHEKKHNKGKLLICATSNAAVDALVIRLLHIRQNLPKTERFRMVRVGRVESMHPRAREVSSQTLASRDTARHHAEPMQPGLSEEISHLEAKINMWRTQAQDSKDQMRVAYCQSRVSQLVNRIALLRTGGGGGGEAVRGDQLAMAERRIIECADIIVTTLSSAHNHKMRGLKRRIALCIIDEAGQAIEPETLIPLTLDVTRLTLIGDPQQLPGYICSQRAKRHGLGESLFSRLTSCAEAWPEGNPVVLLDVQYRMHADIADYPNRAFYASRIRTVHTALPDLTIPPYSIVCISSGDKGQGTSGANEMEAWGVSRLVVALHNMLRPLKLSLAVITPYTAQKDLLKKNIRILQESSAEQVDVNTVDSFQGQERDVVVISLARSQGVGFLTDAGRMNVMLTRAKHALLVCLNPHAMLKNHQWRTLVEDAQKRNFYRTLPNKICQPPSPSQAVNDDILKYVTCSKSRMYK